MATKNIIYGIVTYGAVFILGYYLAGGCDVNKISRNKTYSPAKIEQKLNDYQIRLENLEKKVERFEVKNENK